MDHFAGLDVSVKETSVCIVDPRTQMHNVAAGQKLALCCTDLIDRWRW